MEVAIPLIALGGLYVISNHKEGFRSVNKYTAPNQTTDKYFKPDQSYSKHTKTETFTDLAGRKVNLNDYSENMVPYFGKTKTIGNSLKSYDQSEQVLDNLTGSGSLQFVKTESAPLFKPQENIQNATGAPNQNDFYQSRVNPSLSMNNVKPWQEQHVAPGLDQGYSTVGNGGFNAGTHAREKWVDKTVNELRVETNPKQSFELTGHQGPAQTLVKNLGKEGKVEKYLPEKYFINTPDRYLTTNGLEVASTLRAIQPDPTVHRATATKAYAGVAGNGLVQSVPKHGMYRMDHRQPLKQEGITPAVGIAQNNLSSEMGSYHILPTNRSFQKEVTGSMQGLVSAITAPIMDLVRPTRKEELGLMRYGTMGTTVTNAPIQETVMPPTIKEGTLYSPFSSSAPFNATTDAAYQVSEHQPVDTQRDTTSVSYTGIGGSVLPQPMSTHDAYNATLASDRATHGRILVGNMATFAPIINQTTTKHSLNVQYTGTPGSSITNVPPSVELVGGHRSVIQYEQPQRLEPSLLDAFKNNPYTHSLHSVA